VYATRRSSGIETMVRRRANAMFYRFFNFVSEIPIPAYTGDFRLIDRRIVRILCSMPERARFLRALFDATSGYEGDAKLLTAFPTECHGGPDCSISQVIEGPIEFFSLCEHHALPFHGHAYIGYIAHEQIIGISKLTRLVRLFARRFTVQERVGVEIADELVRVLQPHGVAVHLNAMHLCTQMRGVREGHSRTWTSFWRGNYEQDPQLRTEFLQTVDKTGH